MLKKVSLLLTLTAVLVLSSCSSKMKEMKPEFFTATPEVLEVIGNEVPVTIDGKFPAKFFNKKAVLTITPVLKYKDGEAIAESSTFQGENIRGNDKTISYEKGGNFKMKMTFDYVPEMEDAELCLRFHVNKGKKNYSLPDVKIADGCIATSQLYRQTVATANIAVGEDAFQRVIKQAKEANIMFLIPGTFLKTHCGCKDTSVLLKSLPRKWRNSRLPWLTLPRILKTRLSMRLRFRPMLRPMAVSCSTTTLRQTARRIQPSSSRTK